MNSSQGKNDLQHFLRLAGMQVRHRLKVAERENSSGAPNVTIWRLRLLEELIKEQVPDENTGSAAGPAR